MWILTESPVCESHVPSTTLKLTIRYLFIAVHRIVAVQSLVSRSELLYARARRQGVGMKCRNNSLHSTKKYPSRFSHTRVWGEPQIKMVGNFWVLPRASLSRAAEAQVSFVKILRILSEIHSNFTFTNWRREGDSNPRACLRRTLGFRDQPSTTTLVSLRGN